MPTAPIREPGLAGDRIQNNRGMAHVIARGARRVLFVEPDRDGDDAYPHQHLIDQLRAARFLVLPRTVGQLPHNKDELTVYLSNFDCVVIADVPAERFTPAQHEVIRSNTYDQGCGLVFVGGPDSYGAGGYQKTAHRGRVARRLRNQVDEGRRPRRAGAHHARLRDG